MFNKFLFHIIIILIFNFFNIHCETVEEFCNKRENFDNILCLNVSKQYLTNLNTLNLSELSSNEKEDFLSYNDNEKNDCLIDLKNKTIESEDLNEQLENIEKISEYLSIYDCNKNEDIDKYTECIKNKESLMNFTYEFISNINEKLFSKITDFDFRIIELYLKCLFFSLNSPESFSEKSILTFFDTIKKIIENNDNVLELIKEETINDYFALELNIISNSFNLKDFSEIKNIFETKNKNQKNINNFFYTNDFLQEYIKKITSLNKYLLQYNINLKTKNIFYNPIFNFDDNKFEVSNYTIGTIYIPNKHLKSNFNLKDLKGIGIFIFNNFIIFNRNSVNNKIILPTIVSMKVFDKDYKELSITHIPLDAYYTIEFQRDKNKKFKYCYEYFPNENRANADEVKTENFDDDFIKCRPHNFGSFFIGHIDMNGEILISNSQVVQIIFILIGCFALVVVTGIIMIKLVYKSTNLDISFQDDNLTASLGIKFDENNNNNNNNNNVLDNNNNN